MPHEGRHPGPAQKFNYHAGGKLSRFFAQLGGEDLEKAEQTWKGGTAQLTAGANAVLINDVIGDGIKLGFDVARDARRAEDIGNIGFDMRGPHLILKDIGMMLKINY